MMKSKLKEIYENCAVALLWGVCYLFALLPRCVRYGLFSRFVAYILRRVARYRYDVIMRQLHDSFPEKGEAEIAELCRRYYDHMAEMIV